MAKDLKCLYCGKHTNNMPFGNGMSETFEIAKGITHWYIYHDGGCSNKIKFCPMCGRKLDKEEK
jgi:ribosomal protein S27AE